MKNIFIPLLTLLLLLNSCSESDLYQLPRGEILVEEFYSDPANIRPALDAVYRNFRMYNGFDLHWGDMGTDDALKGGGNPGDSGSGDLAKQDYTYDGSLGMVETYWSSCYTGIFNVNIVLDAIKTMPEGADKNAYLGEATFIRAFLYYTLAKFYGEVPIIDKIEQDPEDYNRPKDSYEDVCNFVEQELDLAASLLKPRSSMGSDAVGRADKGAAIALNCKLASYRKDMTKVKKYAEELFAMNEYFLDPDYTNIFQPTGEWGIGSILEIDYSTTLPQAGWGDPNIKGSMISITMRTRKELGDGSFHPDAVDAGWGFHLPTKSLYDEFEEGDPRRSATMYTVGDSLKQQYMPTIDPEVDDLTKYPENGWFNRKYAALPWSNYTYPAGASPNNYPHNARLIRLADIYLLYAEACYHAGDEGLAREYVNKVRKRARESSMYADDQITLIANPNPNVLPDVTATGNDLLQAIYHERRVELGMEFERTWDLIRTDRTQIIKDLWPNFVDGKHYFMPIPTNEIVKSGGVLENGNGW